MKRFKTRIALMLAVIMVMGSCLTSYAAETASGSVTGSGELEGTVSTDVWNVVLPATVSGDTTYDFILDPEGLIAETEAAKYNGKVFTGDTGLFFANASGNDVSGYSNTSDQKTIVNKSSYAVDITITATVSGTDVSGSDTPLAINETGSFVSDNDNSVYLALTDGTQTQSVKKATKVATMTSTVSGAPDVYEYVYDVTAGDYAYVLKQDASGNDFQDYSFNLTGACNKSADWSDFEEAAPIVEIVYSVQKHADASSTPEATDDYVITISEGIASYTFVDVPDTNADGITALAVDGVSKIGAVNLGNVTYADGVLTFNAAATTNILGAASEVTATINGENFEFTIDK